MEENEIDRTRSSKIGIPPIKRIDTTSDEKDIDKILNESPLKEEEPKKPVKIQTYKPTPKIKSDKPKRKITKKRIIIFAAVFIAILAYFLIGGSGTETCTQSIINSTGVADTISEFTAQMRQSIIDTGTVDININGQIIKLAPYTG